MNGLNINYDEVITLGSQIFNNGDEFNEVVLKVEGVLNELSTCWQGADATKTLNKLSDECKEMEQYALCINEIGLLLQKVANRYQSISYGNNDSYY